MRVAAHTHLLNSTRVGNHVMTMVRELHETPGVHLTVVAPQSPLDRTGRIPDQSTLPEIPAPGSPLDHRWLERLDAEKSREVAAAIEILAWDARAWSELSVPGRRRAEHIGGIVVSSGWWRRFVAY
jgi:hypothetical protein